MLVGAALATGAITAGLISDASEDTAVGALLAQPAAVSVPLAFGTMVLLSLRGRRRVTSAPPWPRSTSRSECTRSARPVRE
jgi:hypothetical protein